MKKRLRGWVLNIRCCVLCVGGGRGGEDVKEDTFIEPSQDLLIHYYKGVGFSSNNALTE
jgi:hypothetical protein